MGTRALMTIRFQGYEFHGFSKFDGYNLMDFLKKIKHSEIPFEHFEFAMKFRLQQPIFYTLSETEIMITEFIESQKALDELWKTEMPEKHQLLNSPPLFQWNVLYPTLALDVLEIFKALVWKEVTGMDSFKVTPLLKLNEEEIERLTSYAQYVYEIDMDKNYWTVSELGKMIHEDSIVEE